MKRLLAAVDWIINYQRKYGEVAGWCYRRVRQGCQAQGILMPSAGSAKQAYEAISTDPEAFGWQRAERLPSGDLPQPCLMFFKALPWSTDSISLRLHWHAALYYNGILYASKNYKMSPYWAKRTVAAYVLKG